MSSRDFSNRHTHRCDLGFCRTPVTVLRNKRPGIISDTEEVTGFNPSIAHQFRCRSEVVFESRIGQHELHVNRSVRAHARRTKPTWTRSTRSPTAAPTKRTSPESARHPAWAAGAVQRVSASRRLVRSQSGPQVFSQVIDGLPGRQRPVPDTCQTLSQSPYRSP